MLKQIENTEERVGTLVRKACEEYPDDVDAATDRMVEEMMAYPETHINFLRANCKQKVQIYLSQRRHKIWMQDYTPIEPTQNAGSLKAAIRNNFNNLMDFPLQGGVPLGRATSEQVRASADYYITHGKSCLERGNWLTLVAKAMGRSTKTVSDVLTEKKLQELKEQVVV